MNSLYTVFILFFQLLSLSVLTNCYICNNTDQEYGNTSYTNGSRWPNGVVKYKLHTSLSSDDKVEVQRAFDEYQRKTCIKFQPWQEGDKDYTSIETDNSICGQGHVCKQGGYQYAKFGGNCRESSTMIHELGHNLCLHHENERGDRDEYVNYSKCQRIPQKMDNGTFKKLYDFDSQMHLSCQRCDGGGWPKKHVSECGPDVNDGLSVLDADNINALYDCQGCYRHRWRPMTSLTSDDRSNMYHFGYYGKYGSRLYHAEAIEAEVLTIPGGLSREGFSYKLVSPFKYGDSELLQIGVPAGRVGRIPFDIERGTGYIAYTTFFGDDGAKEDTIGKVWNRAGELNVAHFPRGSTEMLVSDQEFYILTCSKE
ncbi:Zinc metalloproteinase nas-1 [Orchesella cincta]|uniref:Metalloendopeptidase n=1 Tax=Orchesella cincta TaxID=48709 RepID=A0A1D2MMN7_ORCCI|nr:Zinc metalloproteinase nas-1 [Orchesella cincta]